MRGVRRGRVVFRRRRHHHRHASRRFPLHFGRASARAHFVPRPVVAHAEDRRGEGRRRDCRRLPGGLDRRRVPQRAAPRQRRRALRAQPLRLPRAPPRRGRPRAHPRHRDILIHSRRIRGPRGFHQKMRLSA